MEEALRKRQAVNFGVGFSLSLRQLDLSPRKYPSCLRMENAHYDFHWLIGGFWVNFFLFAFTVLITCFRYPVDIFDSDIILLFYCVSPGNAATHSSIQWEGRLEET